MTPKKEATKAGKNKKVKLGPISSGRKTLSAKGVDIQSIPITKHVDLASANLMLK
jgi:hypothetical protein